MSDTWPMSKIIYDDAGLSNYRTPIYCMLNPNQITYTYFKKIVGSNDNISKYHVSFKVLTGYSEQGLAQFEYYDNQIVAWYSKYLDKDIVENMIKTYTKAEDSDFTMTKID